MAWCMVKFSIADLEAQRHVPLQGAFENVMRAASSPTNAAMFANKYMEAGRTYYRRPSQCAPRYCVNSRQSSAGPRANKRFPG
jgi:hypothetical protein